MIIRCIKSVVMLTSKRVAFTESRLYEVTSTAEGINARNDRSEPHWLLLVNTDGSANWDWFAEHFA